MLEETWTSLLDPKDPLLNYRKKGWSQFESIGLPKPKQEAFQYLTRKQWAFPKRAEPKQLMRAPSQGIVFVDGYFDEGLSHIPAPLVCLGLDQAMRPYGLFLQNRLMLTLNKEKDPFAALNGALFGRGAFLYIPPKCDIALHVSHIYSAGEMATPRLHIYVGRESQLTLTQDAEGASGFSNGMIDWVLESGAKALLIDRAQGGTMQAIRAHLKRDSAFKMVSIGHPLRNSIRVELMEENSEAELLGLCRLDDAQEAHIHAHMEHVAPNARSRQHFKSVLSGRSRFSFEGKIYVHAEAQKTESYQLNNNLILSEWAVANAKPNLEIFADDVKASHGCTTGQLNEEELFYLRSRGLSLPSAREWLIAGFCKEITDHAR
ncbi:MAG: SufD family Fe-S cluster assembly protein [Verrucomicrobia bacterium]|nr:SufD family Fe-S cluster assembly protein [Verrucomicrobiota bacterium]